MSDLGFDYIPMEELEKKDIDELRVIRKNAQDAKIKLRAFLTEVTTVINRIYAQDEVLRTVTPEAARALGLDEARINLIKDLQKKRAVLIKEGKGDVVIKHVKTLTVTPGGVVSNKDGN